MGQRDHRRLLITDTIAVVRHASRRGVTSQPWLARMLIAVALANRMARIVWALMTKMAGMPGFRRHLKGR